MVAKDKYGLQGRVEGFILYSKRTFCRSAEGWFPYMIFFGGVYAGCVLLHSGSHTQSFGGWGWGLIYWGKAVVVACHFLTGLKEFYLYEMR